jgi:hypothetical protein
VFDPDVLRNAPAEDDPVPVIVIGSATEIPPDTDSVPPSDTVVAPAEVPSADAFEIASVPVETVVAPVYVFVPESVKVPVPAFVSAPEVPEITPVNDVEELSPPVVRVPDPSAIDPAPATEPTVSEIPAKLNVPAIDIADPSGTPPVPDKTRDPADTVVDPVYVFAPPKVSEPVPDFVSVETGVMIGSATTTSPAPAKVRAGVPDDAPNPLPDATSKVSVPPLLPIVASPDNVTILVMVFEFDTLTSAPAADVPVPARVNGSSTERSEPAMLTAAPDDTVV